MRAHPGTPRETNVAGISTAGSAQFANGIQTLAKPRTGKFRFNYC